MNPTKKSPKISKNYDCVLCDYVCCKQSEYTKHLSTRKHKILQNPTLNNQTYNCECGKIYKHSSTLYAHKKKCISDLNLYNIVEVEQEKKINDKDDIIMLLLKQNSDLIKEQSDIKQIILEIVKNGTTNTNNNNTINNNNSHNKAFNLNFFLNETCKNAMNITDFVDSIKLELSDLMELGEIGYVESMSKIISKNLNALDETIRPIHCTDKKRETFYIKDEDKWEKEDEDKKKLRNIIFKISNKSLKLLPKYREKYPDYNNSESIHSDEHCKIVIEAVACDKLKDEKIIRNISKATTISKEFTENCKESL